LTHLIPLAWSETKDQLKEVSITFDQRRKAIAIYFTNMLIMPKKMQQPVLPGESPGLSLRMDELKHILDKYKMLGNQAWEKHEGIYDRK
jgi:hypothetical protein